jgi:HAE1 family hydrophobic/amphiphilic exporter-1
MVFVALTVLGFVSLGRVGQELFPEVELPTMVIITVSPGTAPREVESQITDLLEDQTSGINGVEEINSTSFESFSQVVIGFSEGTDMNRAVIDVRESISDIESSFPEGTERSSIFTYSASQTASLELNVVSSTSGIDVRGLTEDILVPRIERVPGVGRVSLAGGKEQALMVELDIDSLQKTGIPIPQILQVFSGENINLPAGSIDISGESITLRTVGEFENVESVGGILVGVAGQVPIFLRDVATIGIADRDEGALVRADGRDAVRITIQKQPDANTVDVNDGVLAAVEQAQELLPAAVRVEIQSNQADTVRQSIGGVVDAGWQGGLLAIVILLIFLRNLRSTAIIATVIPVAVIATMTLIDFGNMTLNLTSMIGITLAIGMFVDNSIVVLESIYRKALVGMARDEAAIQGSEEVSKAVTASTLTTMAVFLPMLFVGGLAGALFQDLSLTIAFSLFMSLAASLSLIPMLSSRFLKVTAVEGRFLDHEISLADVQVKSRSKLLTRIGSGIQRMLQNLDDGYERVISWALDHKAMIVGGAVMLLLISVGSVLLLGTEFLPVADEGTFHVRFETRQGAARSVTSEKVAEIEEIVREIAGEDLLALAGQAGASGFGGSQSSASGAVEVTLVPKDDRSRDIWEITREVDRRVSAEVLDVDHRIQIIGLSSLAGQASGQNADLVIQLTGSDLDAMAVHAEELLGRFEQIDGTRNFRSSAGDGVPETQFVVRREEAATLGISSREIATVLRVAFNGVDVSTFSTDSDDYDIVVILDEADRSSLDAVSRLFVQSPRGDQVPLENLVARIDETGPTAIQRTARTRVIRVLGDLDGTRPLSDVVDEIEGELAAVGAPPTGIQRTIEGSSAEMGTSFQSLAYALLLAVLLVYMVMASQFEDFVNPLIVMGSVPFAIIGLVGALLATNTTFSILAFAGAILLVGIVVNNAIVLIDYMGVLRSRGVGLRDAVVKGGKTRLKPILMTSLTTILGLLPMSLGIGTGAELRYPIGRAVVGGLLTSTLITLILIPVLYEAVEGKIKPAVARMRGRNRDDETSPGDEESTRAIGEA